MRTFKDGDGRDWKLELNLAIAKQLRNQGVDLFDDARLQGLASQIIETVDAIYLICKPQADERGVGDVEFAAMLTPCYDAAQTAFLEELADFFQSLGLTAQARIARAVLDAETKIQDVAGRRMTESDLQRVVAHQIETADAKLIEELARLSGDESTKSPESSE